LLYFAFLVKKPDKFLMGKPSQNYGVSLAILNHTTSFATRHKLHLVCVFSCTVFSRPYCRAYATMCPSVVCL